MADEPSAREHWDSAYATRGVENVSWHQPVPAVSLELIHVLRIASDAAIVDVGGGGSPLAGELAARGFDVTVLDLSAVALRAT
jgi:2-polyprenyl-3-methyl-5-hydroxy-6-metoxy-1,4-benzoquinol methylase